MSTSLVKVPKVELYNMEFNNIEDFIDDSHPHIDGYYRPNQYKEYWEPRMEKAIEGVWGHDYDHKKNRGGFRFMPNNLYYFRNFFQIEVKKNTLDFPTLRGIDWYFAYALAEMEGFSGFEGDKYYTCHDIVRKMEEGIILMLEEKELLEEWKEYLVTPTGAWKKYIKPQNYLWKTFKEPLGKAMYYSEAKNMMWITSRRMGKSYHGICKAQRGYVTDGASSMAEYKESKTRFVAAFCSYGDTYTRANYKKFFQAYDLLDSYGNYKVDEFQNEPGDLDGSGFFWEPRAGGKALGASFTNLYPAEGGKGTVGNGSEIGRFSFNGNPSAAVGIAPNYYFFEEIGTYPDFMSPYSESDKATSRDLKFGSILGVGTGGNFKHIRSVKKAFFKPSSIKGVEFPNVWSKGGRPIGGFVPTQYHKLVYYDELGNYLKDEAYQDAFRLRETERNKGERAFMQHIASHPMVYNDVFIDSSHSYYPKARAAEQLTNVEALNDKPETRLYTPGRLVWPDPNSERVIFVPTDKKPFMNHDDLSEALKSNDLSGCFVRYEEPDPNGRYTAIVDPTSHAIGTSWYTVFIYKWFGSAGSKWMNQGIVGEWIGRHGDMELDDVMALKAMLYFGPNGTICPELNNPNIDTTIEKFNLDHRTEPCPVDACRIASPGFNADKYGYGVYKSKGMKDGMMRMAGQAMSSKVGEVKNEFNEYQDILWIDECRSEMLLNDVTYHTEDGNYDYASAADVWGLLVKQYEITGDLVEKPKLGNDTLDKAIGSLISGGYKSNISSLIR